MRAPSAPSRTERGRKWRARAARLLLLAVTCAMTLGLMELGIRRLVPAYHPLNQVLCVHSPEGLRLGRPSSAVLFGVPGGEFLVTVAYNRWGFRDPGDFSTSSINDLFVVGDSYAFGWGVEQSNCFSAVLERALGRPVYNLAVPGGDLYDYERQLEYARRHGAALSNVVVCVCMENDLFDYAYVQRGPRMQDPEQQARITLRRRALNWLERHSALFVCFTTTVKKSEFCRHQLERSGLVLPIESFNKPNVNDPKVLASSRDVLVEFAHRYNLMVLIVPSRYLWQGSNTGTENAVHSNFVGLLEEAGVQTVDMRPKLEEGGEPLKFYFRRDPHWTADGHAAAAQALLERMQATEPWKTLAARAPAPIRESVSK